MLSEAMINAMIDNAIAFEGGYVNNPNDPGGETKYGITKANHPGVDIRNLSKQQAEEIYKKEWVTPNLDMLTCCAEYCCPKLAGKVFGMMINAGKATAIKCLQRSLRNYQPLLNDDGKWGPMTKKTLETVCAAGNGIYIYGVVWGFASECAGYYRLCATRNPKFQTFLKGWENRAYKI